MAMLMLQCAGEEYIPVMCGAGEVCILRLCCAGDEYTPRMRGAGGERIQLIWSARRMCTLMTKVPTKGAQS